MASTLSEGVEKARKEWPFIPEIEKKHKLPSRLLLAVGWRETRLENIMGDFSQRAGESSPRFHGFGVWQRDSGTFDVDKSYLKSVRKQANDAASLLADNFRILDDWRAAVAAYNCGPGRVQQAIAEGKSVDVFTTGGDYSADVMATRDLLRRRPKADVGIIDDPDRVPPRSFFKTGQRHPNFTLMGKRFIVWLGDDISHDGNGYQPGPVFSSFDRDNVKKCQRLMGDDPDGWFGSTQWERLMQRPPKKAPNGGAAPVSGLRVTQGFGIKSSTYVAGEHTGIDFGSNGDDTIRATAPGVVVVASHDADGFGNYVVVQHDKERFSWYCHLSKRSVSLGDEVKKGQQVGIMGETGKAFGKHLHYQESKGGTGYWDYCRPKLA